MPFNNEGIPKHRTSSPTRASQSDASIVVKVADLINMAMGPAEKNTVNFKMIQTILHILARNMRLLDQAVELRSSDITPPLSTKETFKPSRPESKYRDKTAETAKVKEKADRDKSKNQEEPERDRNKKETKDTASPLSSSSSMDKIEMSKYFEKNNKDEKEQAKLWKIREVYLDDKRKKEREKAIKESRYTDKERSLDGNEKAKYRKQGTPSSASSSSVLSSSITYDSSDDDLNQMLLNYEIERIEKDSELEQEQKLAKIAKLREVYVRRKERGNEKEKAKVANMNDEQREIYLTEKAGRKRERERERYDKEKAILAKFNDNERKKYFVFKEEKEKAIVNAEDKYRAENESERSETDTETYEIETVQNDILLSLEEQLAKIAKIREVYLRKKEREMANLGNLNDEEREQYLKDKSKRSSVKERERHEKKIEKTAEVNDVEKNKYLNENEERENALNKREQYEKNKSRLPNLIESEREKYLNQKEKEEREMAKDRKRADRDKEKEREGYEIEKENFEEREKYFGDQEQRDSRKLDAKDSDKTEEDESSEGKKYLQQKEKEESEKSNLDLRDKKIERERYQNEMKNFANIGDEKKEKEIKDKEEREKTDFNIQERQRAGSEIDEKEKANIIAKLNESEREQYLKQKDKDKTEKSKIDELAKKRAVRGKEREEQREKEEEKELETEREYEHEKRDQEHEKERDANQEKDREKEREEEQKEHETEREFKDKKERDKEHKKERKVDRQKERKKERDQKQESKLEKQREKDHINENEKEREIEQEKEPEKERDKKQEKQLEKQREKDHQSKQVYGKENEQKKERDKKEKKRDEREKEREKELEKEREKELEKEQEKKREKERGKERGKEREKERGGEREKERDRQRKIGREQEVEREQDVKREREMEREREINREREMEREREKERERDKEKGRGTNIKEKEWGKGKDSRTRAGSIEVVTRSEFELLEAKVNELEEKTAPIPYPSMPDNEKLRTDLARGRASLTDTMEAMQVSARVQATETAMSRMADLLSQLAAAGALPQDVVKQVGEVTAGMASGEAPRGTTSTRSSISRGELARSRRSIGTSPTRGLAETLPRDGGHKNSRSVGSVIDERIRSVGISTPIDERVRSVGIGTPIGERIRSVAIIEDGQSRHSLGTSMSTVGKKYSGLTTASRAHFTKSCVTHPELDDAQRGLKDTMIRKINDMVLKALRLAEIADMAARKVSDQMEIATRVSDRIDELFSLVNDYGEQLSGFDAGVSTQLQNFNEIIFQIRCELNDGIVLFNQTMTNSETEAVKELNNRYEDLVMDLDETRNTLRKLDYFQNAMGDEVTNIQKSIEAMREQKADREELLDGMRDKADKHRLDGLLRDLDFEPGRIKMEERLEQCYNKFSKQEEVWMKALEDLNKFAVSKASGNELFAFTYQTEIDLNKLKDETQSLATALGEPKALLLARKISEGGTCGPCQAPALQDPTADCQPLLLPAAMQRHPPIAEEPCTQLVKEPRQLGESEHICKRWTGGSHTLINRRVLHQDSGDIHVYMPPTKKYAGIGNDGKLYQLEELLQPCGDCNKLDIDEETKVQDEGAGEPGLNKVELNFKQT